MAERFPNLIIVGAPKCGTTALAARLGAHPSIFMAPRKEMHYFGADLLFDRPRLPRERYLQEFAGWRDQAYGGEASVYYLSSATAAREMHRVRPDARIVCCLRDPVEAMHSCFYQLHYTVDEDLKPFAAALAAEAGRAQGRRIPKYVHGRHKLFYRRTYRYADQVERYLDTFGAAQVHVVLYDDVRRDMGAALAQLQAELALPVCDLGPNDIVNANKEHVVRWMSAAAHGRIEWFNRLIWRLSRPIGGGRRTFDLLQTANRRWNTRYSRRPPPDPALRAALEEEFAPDVRRLSGLIGRDLSHWLKGTPGTPASGQPS